MPNDVRTRSTYKFWKDLLDFLNTNPTKADILRKIHAIIDERRGFASETNSRFSKESLELVIRDNQCPKCNKVFEIVALASDYVIEGCAEHREFDKIRNL